MKSFELWSEPKHKGYISTPRNKKPHDRFQHASASNYRNIGFRKKSICRKMDDGELWAKSFFGKNSRGIGFQCKKKLELHLKAQIKISKSRN